MITSKIETITPDKAKGFLLNNKSNRPVSERNLRLLTNEMKRNNFHLTGESIKVAENGMLLDGQHRLLAIVATGKNIDMLVTRGLSNDAFKYIDTGKIRNAADVLGIEGIKNSAAIAAMSQFIIRFERGVFSDSVKITNADVSNFVGKHHKSLVESFGYGHNKENKLIPATTLASFHFIFKKINEGQSDDFCWKVAKGENLTKESPIYLLRQKMLQDIRSSKKMKRIEKIALIVKAWNAYRKKTPMKVLVWNSIKEPFPKAA